MAGIKNRKAFRVLKKKKKGLVKLKSLTKRHLKKLGSF